MRDKIHGLPDHPSDLLGGYRSDAPDGIWTGRFDDRAWGRSANLFCYFTDMASGKHYRLSVFFDKAYRPANSGPAMDQEPLGHVYKITTKLGKTGLSRFIAAEPVDPVATT